MQDTIALQPEESTGPYPDRPVFEVRIRGSFGRRRYQVFGFEKGLLLLDTGKVAPNPGEATGIVIGGLVGGAVGGALGSAIGGALDSELVGPDADFSRRSNDELLALARRTKHSKVAAYDDIESVSIDVPSIMGRFGHDGSLQGLISLRERTLGKLKMEVHDLFSMATAVEAFTACVGDRTTANVELDKVTCMFKRKRR